MDEILRLSDIYALTSDSEAFPNVVLEAMATGVAVVATDVGSVGEVVEDDVNGLLVHPGDVDGLSRALSRLCDDREYAGRLASRGREFVTSRFTLSEMVRQREAFLAGFLCDR